MKTFKKTAFVFLIICSVIITSLSLSVSAAGYHQSFPCGTYKIGEDIPAGTYRVSPLPGETNLKYKRYKGEICEENLYEWWLLDQPRIVHLKEGDYFIVEEIQ